MKILGDKPNVLEIYCGVLRRWKYTETFKIIWKYIGCSMKKEILKGTVSPVLELS
jgi:hypothetical protein